MSGSERRGSAARRAFRHRGFRLLALAMLGSNLGTWAYQVAIVAYLYSATHSTAWIAALSLARMLPSMALGPFAGALADRFDRRSLMVLSDLVRAGLMVVLTVIVATDAPPAAILATVAVAVVAGSVYVPSVAAELPELLGEDDLAAGNATTALMYNVTMFAGPALGGLLLIVASPAVAVAVNAASFALSAVLVRMALAARTYERGSELRASESLLRTALGGVHVLLGDGARRAVAMTTLANYVMYGTLGVLLVALAQQSFSAGSKGYSWLIGAFGAGGVAAALVADRVASSRRAASGLFAALVLSAVPMCLLGFANSLWAALVLVFAVGLGLCVVDITGITLLQRLTPANAIGRAFGLFDGLNYATTLLGVLVAPPLASWLGVDGAVVAVAIAVPAVCLFTAPALLRADVDSARSTASLARRVRLLAGTEIFGPCPHVSLERLAAEASTRSADANEVIIRQGETADDLYVVVHGRLQVTDERAEQHLLRTLDVGDAFGEIGLLTGGRRTATVTTSTPSVLLRIPGEVFMECVQATPPLAETVNGVIATRLALSRRRVPTHVVAAGATP